MKLAHLKLGSTVQALLLLTLSKVVESDQELVGRRLNSTSAAKDWSFPSDEPRRKLNRKWGINYKKDGLNSFTTYSKHYVPFTTITTNHKDAETSNDDEDGEEKRNSPTPTDLVENLDINVELPHEREWSTKTYERVVLEGSSIRISCPHSNVPTIRRNTLFFQSKVPMNRNANEQASSAYVYNGEKQFVDPQQNPAVNARPTIPTASVVSLDQTVKWFRNHVPLQNLNHFQHAKQQNGNQQRDQANWQRAQEHYHQQMGAHDGGPLLSQGTTINITELRGQKAPEHYQTAAPAPAELAEGTGATGTWLAPSSTTDIELKDNNNEQNSDLNKARGLQTYTATTTTTATATAQLNLLTKGSHFSSTPSKRIAKLLPLELPLTSENANEQHQPREERQKKVRKFSKLLEASSHGLAGSNHGQHQLTAALDDEEEDEELIVEDREERLFEQTENNGGWHINEFGELVINRVSQYFAGKYTCLVGGQQSELLLDVVRLVPENRAERISSGQHIKKPKRKNKRADLIEKEWRPEVGKLLTGIKRGETRGGERENREADGFFPLDSYHLESLGSGDGPVEKRERVDENKSFESKTVSTTSTRRPGVSISNAYEHPSGSEDLLISSPLEADDLLRGKTVSSSSSVSSFEPTIYDKLPPRANKGDQQEALTIRDTLTSGNSIKTLRACDVANAANFGNSSSIQNGDSCREMLDNDKPFDVEENHKLTGSEEKIKGEDDFQLKDIDQIRERNLSLRERLSLNAHKVGGQIKKMPHIHLPASLLDLQKHPAHLVKSETIQTKDLKSFPGFLYTKQRLYCPLSLSLNDFKRAFIHPITQKVCSTQTPIHLQSTQFLKDSLKLECHQSIERLIYKLILMSQQKALEDCSTGELDEQSYSNLFALNWFKDGDQLIFDEDTGRMKGINLNARIISNLSDHQFFANNLVVEQQSGGKDEKLSSFDRREEKNTSQNIEPSSFKKRLATGETYPSKTRLLSQMSLVDVISPNECPLKGRTLQLDGVKRDSAGRYTCALTFHLSKLEKIVISNLQQIHQNIPANISPFQAHPTITILNPKQPCLSLDNDKKSCQDPEPLESEEEEGKKRLRYLRKRSTSNDEEAQFEPIISASGQLEFKKDEEPRVEENSENSATKREDVFSDERLSSSSDSILKSEPIYKEQLDYILETIAKLHNPTLVLQTFSLVVVERSADSSDLWSTITEASNAYTRRKLDDFKRLKGRRARSSALNVEPDPQSFTNNVNNPNSDQQQEKSTSAQLRLSSADRLWPQNGGWREKERKKRSIKRQLVEKSSQSMALDSERKSASNKLKCLSGDCKLSSRKSLAAGEEENNAQGEKQLIKSAPRKELEWDKMEGLPELEEVAIGQTMNEFTPSNYANEPNTRTHSSSSSRLFDANDYDALKRTKYPKTYPPPPEKSLSDCLGHHCPTVARVGDSPSKMIGVERDQATETKKLIRQNVAKMIGGYGEKVDPNEDDDDDAPMNLIGPLIDRSNELDGAKVSSLGKQASRSVQILDSRTLSSEHHGPIRGRSIRGRRKRSAREADAREDKLQEPAAGSLESWWPPSSSSSSSSAQKGGNNFGHLKLSQQLSEAEQRAAHHLSIDIGRPRPFATYDVREGAEAKGSSRIKQAPLDISDSGSGGALESSIGGEEEESLMWSAGQYLYMHMRALASSSLFGVEVGVEWSNERANGSSLKLVDQVGREYDGNHDDDDDDDDVGETTYSRYARLRAPFATVDVISGQNLHLKCTAHTLGRLAEVKWYKLIHKYPSRLEESLVNNTLRRIGGDLYWPLTELDLLSDDSLQEKSTRFVCSQTTSIFDNLINQTFTVINSLHLSQYKDLPEQRDTNRANEQNDYNLYACIVDADVRHNYATLGVHFRQAPTIGKRMLPIELSKRLLARRSMLSKVNSRPSPGMIAHADSGILNNSRAVDTFSGHFDLFRENNMQTVPLKSYWVPIQMSDLQKNKGLHQDSIVGKITFSPSTLIMIIMVVFSSLVGLIYLTLRSYKALTELQLEEQEFNEPRLVSDNEQNRLQQLNEEGRALIRNNPYLPYQRKPQLFDPYQLKQSFPSSSSELITNCSNQPDGSLLDSQKNRICATPTSYFIDHDKDLTLFDKQQMVIDAPWAAHVKGKPLYEAHMHNVEVTHNCNCHQAALTQLIQDRTNFGDSFPSFAFPEEEEDEMEEDEMEPSCCRVQAGLQANSSFPQVIPDNSLPQTPIINMVENPFSDV